MSVCLMQFLPLIRLRKVGYGLVITQVGGETVVPHLWFSQVHFHKRSKNLRSEVDNLAGSLINIIIQLDVLVVHPHDVVAGHVLRRVGGQVHGVELVGGEGPGLTVSDGPLGHQRVGQLGQGGEAQVGGLGRQPAPAGQHGLARHHVPVIGQF